MSESRFAIPHHSVVFPFAAEAVRARRMGFRLEVAEPPDLLTPAEERIVTVRLVPVTASTKAACAVACDTGEQNPAIAVSAAWPPGTYVLEVIAACIGTAFERAAEVIA